MGVGEGGARAVAREGGGGDGGTTWVGEAEDFSDLVETFADGVVEGGADNLEGVGRGHVDELGVAARDDEGEEGEGGGMVGVEPVGVDMRLEMVNGVEGFVVEEGEGAGGQSADEEGTEKAWGVGDGDGVDVVPGEGGVGEGAVEDGEDGFEVGTGGDFGDDATVGFENVNLGNDNVRQNTSPVLDNGDGSFVAGGFDG